MKKTVDIPVIAFGRINDPVMAENILARGHADLIGMCRQLICDPETPTKTAKGAENEIRHCVACMEGCMGSLRSDGVLCIQNPAAGREKKLGIGTLIPAVTKKRVMVVGAGVAGLKAAEICSERGHEVTICEKSGEIGGQALLAEKIPCRAELSETYRYSRVIIERNGVDVRLNTEATLEMVEAANPDVVIIATGSTPNVRDFPGQAERKFNVMDSRSALLRNNEIGDNVLLYDDIGYWQGCGVADYASIICKKITVVTPKEKMGIDIEDTNSFMLHRRLYRAGATIITQHVVKEIRRQDIIVENIFNHEKTIVSDVNTLIVAGPSHSDDTLYKELKKSAREVYAIGDAVAPRTIRHAILNAEEVARAI